MKPIKEKKERSLGAKLFLKADRCGSPKCVMVRRPYPPGARKRRRSFRSGSEFSRELLEKQRVRMTYGLSEAQMKNVFEEASRKAGVSGAVFMELLERRLDNVLFRLGLAPSRRVARQLVSHGHVLVNGRRVTVPSRRVTVGDVVEIAISSRGLPLFGDLELRLKRQEPPAWLKLEGEKGTVTGRPEELESFFDINKVVEYYSR